jgi:hypothetical protein
MATLNLTSKLEGKGYPIYTKKISDIATIYIIDNEIYKSRAYEYNKNNIITDKKINDILNKYNNVVVQEDDIVHIYCTDEKLIDRYRQEIQWLKENIYSNIEDKVVFNK